MEKLLSIVLIILIIFLIVINKIIISNYRNLVQSILNGNFFNLTKFNKRIFAKALNSKVRSDSLNDLENYLQKKSSMTMSIEDYLEYRDQKS